MFNSRYMIIVFVIILDVSVVHIVWQLIVLFLLDVGFKVGKNSDVKYIVIQVHYRMPMSRMLLTYSQMTENMLSAFESKYSS